MTRPIAIDRASRKAWWTSLYDECHAELRRRLRTARLLLAGIVIVEIVLPIGIALLGWWIALQEMDAAQSPLSILYPSSANPFALDRARAQVLSALAVVLLVVVGKGSNALMVVVAAWSDLVSLRFAIRRKRLVAVGPSAAPLLHRIAAEVAAAMGLGGSSITIWLSLSPSFLPSVIERRGIHLLVPLGFLGMAESDEPSCRAILGHEFAHVVHRDTELWRRSQLLAWSIFRINLPIALFLLVVLQVLSGAVIMATATTGDGSLIGQAILLVVVGALVALPVLLEYGAYLTTIRARRCSEDAADLLSAIHGDPVSLAAAIRSYVADGADDAQHRSKGERVAWLEALAGDGPLTSPAPTQDERLTRLVMVTVACSIASIALFVVLLHGTRPLFTLVR